jgi:hypothetical protein
MQGNTRQAITNLYTKALALVSGYDYRTGINTD